MSAWLNDCTRLFYRTGSEPVPLYLSHVGIRNIVWKGELEIACKYCGTKHAKKSCPGCQDRSSGTVQLGVAEVEFFGNLPYCLEIFYLDGWVEALVCHGKCTDPCVFWEESVIMRLSDFEIKERNIPSLAAMSPSEVALMGLRVKVACKVELLWDAKEDVHA